MTALEPRAVEGLAGRRVLVTGGAGFIGSTLCHTLARSGADVTVYDNLATGSLDNLRDGAEVPPPRFLHGDVRDRERLARVLGGVDVVYHLACLGVRHSIHSPHENLDVNARGTLTVLTQALEARPARVVHVSSSEVYGTARTVPMSEDHPTDPSTVYGAGKLAGECCARALHRCDGLDVVVLRPFNAYGPGSHFEGDSGEVIPRFVVRALSGEPLVVFGDGTQTRDLSHVHDTAATIARAGVVEGIAGRTLNIGTGVELSVNALAATVLDVTGSRAGVEHVEPRPGDVLRLCADGRAAEEALGHRPRVTLDEGIADLVERWRNLGREALARMAAGIVVRNWS